MNEHPSRHARAFAACAGATGEARLRRASIIPAALYATAALLLACSTLSAQSPAETDSSRNAADGAYTDDQAKRGQVVFGSTCGNCHGITEFNGPTFRRIWKGRTVYDMFDQLRNTMPLDNPGGLSREQYTGVIAYLMKLNEYPAGESELPVADDALRRIRF